jgi:hypothetical protein
LASCNFLATRTLVASFTKVNVRVKDDGQGKKKIGETLQNIKLVDTLSPLKFQ